MIEDGEKFKDKKFDAMLPSVLKPFLWEQATPSNVGAMKIAIISCGKRAMGGHLHEISADMESDLAYYVEEDDIIQAVMVRISHEPSDPSRITVNFDVVGEVDVG